MPRKIRLESCALDLPQISEIAGDSLDDIKVGDVVELTDKWYFRTSRSWWIELDAAGVTELAEALTNGAGHDSKLQQAIVGLDTARRFLDTIQSGVQETLRDLETGAPENCFRDLVRENIGASNLLLLGLAESEGVGLDGGDDVIGSIDLRRWPPPPEEECGRIQVFDRSQQCWRDACWDDDQEHELGSGWFYLEASLKAPRHVELKASDPDALCWVRLPEIALADSEAEEGS